MVGRYQTYPEYKDSGVEWVGEIPQEWELWKIIHACPYVASGTTPKTGTDFYYGGRTPWITTGELRENLIFDTQKKVTDQALVDMPTLRLHPKGSVAIAMYGATIGRLGIFGVGATTNQACCVMPPSRILHGKYLFYWLYATRKEIINLSSGGGQPNVNQEKIASLKVSCPDFLFQVKIAKFLDHETAKIDTLIEKQQQLIALLKEKRQAVISHAVTKGLNPDTPMKDSGVEWLGDVPEHWIFTETRYIAGQIGGGTPSKENQEYWDGDIPWVSPKDMKVDYIDTSQDKITFAAITNSSTKLIPTGSILVVVRGMILVHSVPVALTTREVTINQDMKALVPNDKISGEFLLLLFKGLRDFILDLVDSSAHGTKCLRTELFERMRIAIPNRSEQDKIVSTINAKIVQVDLLLKKAEAAINLLQERRTALISAAVTGKIDVRNWQPPTTPQKNTPDTP